MPYCYIAVNIIQLIQYGDESTSGILNFYKTWVMYLIRQLTRSKLVSI